MALSTKLASTNSNWDNYYYEQLATRLAQNNMNQNTIWACILYKHVYWKIDYGRQCSNLWTAQSNYNSSLSNFFKFIVLPPGRGAWRARAEHCAYATNLPSTAACNHCQWCVCEKDRDRQRQRESCYSYRQIRSHIASHLIVGARALAALASVCTAAAIAHLKAWAMHTQSMTQIPNLPTHLPKSASAPENLAHITICITLKRQEK